MEMGFAAAAALWLASGVLFWSVFVALGFGFQPASDEEGIGRSPSASHGGSTHPRGAPTQVMARTRE